MTGHDHVEKWLACFQVGEEGKHSLFEGSAEVGCSEGGENGYLLLIVEDT